MTESAGSLRIVIISDTHNKHKTIKRMPKGDVLIHCVDFSSVGDKLDLDRFKAWFSAQPHNHRIFIAGNHDIPLHKEWYIKRGAMEFHTKYFRKPGFDPVAYADECEAIVSAPGSVYLEDSSYTIPESGINVYGSPWQPEFFDWAFNLERGQQLKDVWDKIPADTDVLLTHGPPYGILDLVDDGTKCGCEDLLREIQSRETPPRLHIFGHIHEGYGTHMEGKTLFINGSTCNGKYRPINVPIVVDLPFDRASPAVVVPLEDQECFSEEEIKAINSSV